MQTYLHSAEKSMEWKPVYKSCKSVESRSVSSCSLLGVKSTKALLSLVLTTKQAPGTFLKRPEINDEEVEDGQVLVPVWPDWAILKVLSTKFLEKIAQIFGNVWGHFEKCFYLSKNSFSNFWATLGQIGLLFIPTYCHTGWYTNL